MLPCRYGASCTRQSTCSFAHPSEVREAIPCKFGAACTKPSCIFSHPSDKACPYGSQCTNSQCNLLHPEHEICYDDHCNDPNCPLQHLAPHDYSGAYYDSPNRTSPVIDSYSDQQDRFEKEVRPCRFGDKCTNSSCPFSHPADTWGDEVKPCRYGERCLDPKCPFTHLASPVEGPRLLQPLPPKPKGCKYGDACTDPHCTLLHLSDNPQICPNGDACTDPNCAEVHPDGVDPLPCIDGAKCIDPACIFTHPSPESIHEAPSFSPVQVDVKQCRWGANCSDPRCTFSHLAKPSKPARLCRYGVQCTDAKCAFLHPDEKDESARPMPRHNRYVATLEFIFKDCNLACDMRLRRLIERGRGGQPGDLDDDTTEPDDEVHWKVDATTNTIRNNWREGGWVYLPALLDWHPDTQNLDMDIRAVAAKLKHKPDATIEVSADLEWIRRKGNRILPPKRPWKWHMGYTVEDGFKAFTVATWNLQADMTRTNSDGTNRSLLALGKRQILQGLGMPPQLNSPGICCLQELQTMGQTAEAGPGSKYDHASGMVKLLEAQGYGGRLYPSMKNTIGIFWKSSEFNLEEEHILSYSISYKGAIFVLLRHLPTRRRLMVATTHLSVPVDKYSKFIGFKPLLEITECLKEILALRKQWADEHGPPPLILAGDFNSEVDSSVYQLLTKGAVDEDNVDVQVAHAYGLKVELPLVYPPLPCSSTLAEVLGKEPDYTNVNAEMEFVATLDYIMHNGFKVEGTLDVFPEQPLALPNEQIPSDHMPLCSLFSFLPSSAPVIDSPRKDPVTPSAVTVASANKRTFTLPSPTQNSMRQRESTEMLLAVDLSPVFGSEPSPAPSPVTPNESSTASGLRLGMSRSSSLASMDGTLESPVRLSKRLQKLIAMKEQDREQPEVKIHMQESGPSHLNFEYPKYLDDARMSSQHKSSGAGLVYENYSTLFNDQPRTARPSVTQSKPISEKPSSEVKQRKDRLNDEKARKPIQRLVQLRPDTPSPQTSPSKPRKDHLVDPLTESVRILKASSSSERTVLGTMRTENEGVKTPEGYNRDLVRQQRHHDPEQIDVISRHKDDTKARDYEHRRARRSFDETEKRDDSKGARARPKIIVVDGQPKERRDSERQDSSKESWKGQDKKNAASSSPADHVRTLVVKPSPTNDGRPVLPRPASAHSADMVRILKTEGRPVLPKPRSASSSPAMSALTPPFTSTAGTLSRSWSPKLSILSSSSPPFVAAVAPPKPKPIFTVRTLKPQVSAK